MADLVKIPMPDSIFDELDDAFVGEKESAQDFVWGLIRNLCKDAKLGKLNKVCTVNAIKDGVQVQEQIKLKGFELDIVPSDPYWIPQNIDKEDIKYFEHKVTDKTMEYLRLYASFAVLRHKKYADSIEAENNKKLDKMMVDKVDPKITDEAKENYSAAVKKFREGTPKCLEEIVFNSVYPSIHQKVNDNIDKELDKENEEMYPKEDKTSK